MTTLTKLRSDRGFLRDASGRVCILRGVNVSGRSKMPPFLPFRDPGHFEVLRSWGFNVIRLLVLWEALAPTPDDIDEDYLARIRGLAEAATQRGLYVIVDFHQDLFARCLGGDGAPAWAVPERDRFAHGRGWFLRYVTSKAVRHASQRFWRDADGIQSAFLRALRRTMQCLAQVDGVIGFDPWNEPMSNLSDLATGRLEHDFLPEFYQVCARLRDEVAPELLLFFEPPPVTAFGMPSRLVPLDLPGSVYTPHVYEGLAIAAHRFHPLISTTRSTLRQHLTYARHHEVPIFVGEFGALYQMPGAAALLERQCRDFDRHFVGWTAWHYDPSHADWNEEDASIVEHDGRLRSWAEPLIRPYPRALAGDPISWDSDEQWRLRYKSTLRSPTEIVVPRRWSPGRIDAEVDGGLASVDDAEGVVRVEGQVGREIAVTLHRRR